MVGFFFVCDLICLPNTVVSAGVDVVTGIVDGITGTSQSTDADPLHMNGFCDNCHTITIVVLVLAVLVILFCVTYYIASYVSVFRSAFGKANKGTTIINNYYNNSPLSADVEPINPNTPAGDASLSVVAAYAMFFEPFQTKTE
jgi:hypothetical protein